MRPAIFLALLAPLLLESCTEYCTQLGCSPVVSLCVPVVSTTHLRVCRNTTCSEVMYTPEPTYSLNGLGPITRAQGCIDVAALGGEQDGDVYTLTGWDANGNVVDDYRWTATYETSYPNGEACGPACPVPMLTQSP